MKNIIKESLKKSRSYKSYRAFVAQLVENKSTSGNDKSEEMVDYTVLNDRRMKRWDKTLKVTQEVKDKIAKFNTDITWLVIAESWCGDAAHLLPVMNKIAELNTNIDFKVVLRDDNEALMNLFLTNGNKAVPKLIMIDSASRDVIDSFGPRPSKATKMVKDYKTKHGVLTPKFKEDLQRWYNNDKGQTTIEELTKKLQESATIVSL